MLNHSELKIPSFSIIFETENLASVELENIYRSLASIATQEISPTQANEFLMIDSGNAPPEVIEQLCQKYPWIQMIHQPGIHYYDAKRLGAQLATGEVIVYCDSDCIYEPQWLTCILTTFSQSSDINIVAGETSTPIRNLYELAIALHYFFPRFSQHQSPYRAQNYFLNAVAFRREFLLQNPIPTDLPLYRGNCLLHSYYWCSLKGEPLWKHPQARAIHEPPTPSFIFWRYLLKGRDRVLKNRIKCKLKEGLDLSNAAQLSAHAKPQPGQKLSSFARILMSIKPFRIRQMRRVLSEKSHYLFLFILAVPTILWFELIYILGSLITCFQPDFLLKLYQEKEVLE